MLRALFRRPVVAAPPPASEPLVWGTQPAALNLSGQPQIEQALYRLDQICRHWEQHVISDAKRAEFEVEAALHVISLRGTFAKLNNEAGREALLAKLEGYVARLKACGWAGVI